MAKRTLQELNLLDDFLFGSMLTYPEIGEAFSRELLKIIFQKEFGHLVVVPQKVYYGSDTDKHGARLDVYLEEVPEDGTLEKATIYDVEPNLDKYWEKIESLPKRVRFYHAMIDAKSLNSGSDYQNLKNVIVIMITPFDPFGYDQVIYTIKSHIEELPKADYEDGARTLFLYTKGNKGNFTKELKQFLHYMEETTEENANNADLKRIHHMVKRVKEDKEVSLEYMKIFEREQMLIQQGIEQGIERGIEQGKLQEQENTERERARAVRECNRADAAEKEVKRLQEELRKLKEN